MKKPILLSVLLTYVVVCVTDNALGQNTNKNGNGDHTTAVACDKDDVSHCGCYLSGDCSDDNTVGCNRYRTCTACDGGGNSDFDGKCTGAPGIFIHDVLGFANALDHYVMAFEITSKNGGGVPDDNMIRIANSFNLEAELMEHVRKLAISIVDQSAGLTECSISPCVTGYLTLPTPEEFFAGENGTIEEMPKEILNVVKTVRQAFTSQLITNGEKGLFEKKMKTIYKIAPNYTGFGRCQFPHPSEHGHEFIFQDAVDCLTKELVPFINGVLSVVKEKGRHDKCPIKSYKIFPNPVHKSNQVRFEIDIPNCSNDPKELIIRDVLGIVITSRPLNKGKNEFMINASDLNNNKVCRCDVVVESQTVASKTLVVLE